MGLKQANTGVVDECKEVHCQSATPELGFEGILFLHIEHRYSNTHSNSSFNCLQQETWHEGEGVLQHPSFLSTESDFQDRKQNTFSMLGHSSCMLCMDLTSIYSSESL